MLTELAWGSWEPADKRFHSPCISSFCSEAYSHGFRWTVWQANCFF